MSKSTLKLKHFEIFNLQSYMQELNDDILQEEEDIIDIIHEASQESKFIFIFLIITSKGTLIYLEYNTTNKKLTKIYRNPVLSSIITNEIVCCELSFTSPILIATSLNEIILIETKQKPSQLVNLTEENIIISSAYCENSIVDIKFNCNQTTILVVTVNKVLLYRLAIDKYENKQILNLFTEVVMPGQKIESIDYSSILNTKYFPKFSDFNENILFVSFLTDEKITEKHTKISLDQDDSLDQVFYFNIIKLVLNKKDVTMKVVKSYSVEKTFIKVCFSYLNEKIFFLFEDGIICCVNSFLIKPNKEDKEIYDDKLVFKYPLSSAVKFCDIYFHPSSNFIVVKDTQNDYLIFDFTLNLYYIMQNSKITVKLNMKSFSNDGSTVKQIRFKPYEMNYFVKNGLMKQNSMKKDQNKTSEKLEIDDFRIEKNIQNMIFTGLITNNSLFFYDSKIVNGIFIEISAKFNQSDYLNPLLDEFQLLKNHLRGFNFDSSFKILAIIQNFSLWIQALFLIVNKICHSPGNILLLKKHSLAYALQYLKEKTFDDETKNATVNNIKILCFTNLLYRCLSIKQYEYAFLIAEKLNLPFLYKVIVSHSKLNKFLGVSYLACNKLEVMIKYLTIGWNT
jgi:hypothetical protein